MKKLSEIIKLAMPRYQALIDRRIKNGENLKIGPGMCYAVDDARNAGEITQEEARLFDKAITKRLNGFSYLSNKLHASKKGASWQHRVAYYQNMITQLEKKGK